MNRLPIQDLFSTLSVHRLAHPALLIPAIEARGAGVCAIAEAVQRKLGLPDHMMTRLRAAPRPDASPGPELPSNQDAAELMERLGVEPVDRATTLAARPDPAAHPELWWVLDAHVGQPVAEVALGVIHRPGSGLYSAGENSRNDSHPCRDAALAGPARPG